LARTERDANNVTLPLCSVSNVLPYHLSITFLCRGGLWSPGGEPPEGSNGTWENVEDVTTPKGACIPAKFIDNYDGYTITVHIMGWPWLEERVRLIGVDTPEKGEGKAAVRATRFTRNTLANKTVYLEFDTRLRDKYNRLLAYVWFSAPGKTWKEGDV